MRRQNGVAIKFGLDPHGRMEPRGHGQAFGDGFGLIHLAGAGPAHVQLLKADDVGFVFADHGDDAIDIQTLVRPDAAMDVIGQKAGHDFPGTCPNPADG